MKLGHLKSRNGCALCKKRRVKCDEKRPCGACEKHNVTCSLVEGATTAVQSVGVQSTSRIRKLRHTQRVRARNPVHTEEEKDPQTNNSNHRHIQPHPSPLVPVSFDEVPDADPRIMDLELMQHFINTTAKSFPTPTDAFWVFAEHIPRLAMLYPYLLHQMLAISAVHSVHLASPNTRNNYLTYASQHQSYAITGMRKVLFENMTEESSFALYICTGLLMATTFAYHNLADKQSGACPIEGLMEAFVAMRGSRVIYENARAQLESDILSYLIGGGAAKVQSGMLPSVRSQLEVLDSQMAACETLSDAEMSTVRSAIAALDKSTRDDIDGIGRRIMESNELRSVFVWPRFLELEFISLLNGRHPAALVVLLHYSVILQTTEPVCWFFNGWSDKLTKTIPMWVVESPWREMAQWPLERLVEGKERNDSSSPRSR